MGISLFKGQRVNLSKEPDLEELTVGLGWDVNQTDTGTNADLDSSVFMLGSNNKIPNDSYFIFYNNLQSPDGSVVHQGDNRTGMGEGDDETILVNLPKVDAAIQDIIVAVTIHNAEEHRQNFGQVRNAYIRLINNKDGSEVLRYDLDEDFSAETAVEFGRLYRKDGDWRFQAVGNGYKVGLQGFVDQYM